ncbi:hypothetical protein U1Q18_002298, partial [Sarracenia purpurea var. burkii]
LDEEEEPSYPQGDVTAHDPAERVPPELILPESAQPTVVPTANSGVEEEVDQRPLDERDQI